MSLNRQFSNLVRISRRNSIIFIEYREIESEKMSPLERRVVRPYKYIPRTSVLQMYIKCVVNTSSVIYTCAPCSGRLRKGIDLVHIIVHTNSRRRAFYSKKKKRNERTTTREITTKCNINIHLLLAFVPCIIF